MNVNTCTARRHGTERAYRDYQCRCPETRALMRTLWRDRYRRERDQGRLRPYHRPSRRPTRRGWVRDNTCDDLEVVRILSSRGWSAVKIADHLGCAPRTVTRWRSRLAGRAA
jgi:hypothetical protein